MVSYEDTMTTEYECVSCGKEMSYCHHVDDDSVPVHCGLPMIVWTDV